MNKAAISLENIVLRDEIAAISEDSFCKFHKRAVSQHFKQIVSRMRAGNFLADFVK